MQQEDAKARRTKHSGFETGAAVRCLPPPEACRALEIPRNLRVFASSRLPVAFLSLLRRKQKAKGRNTGSRPFASRKKARVSSLLLFGRGGRRSSRVSRSSRRVGRSRAVSRSSRVSRLLFRGSRRRIGRGRLGGGFATASNRTNGERTNRNESDQRTNRHGGSSYCRTGWARTWNRRPSNPNRLTHKAQRTLPFR